MEERRHASRVTTALSVLVGEEGCVEVERATLLSLSASGAFVAMAVRPDPDRSVRVLLDKPDGGRVSLRGRVVRVTPEGVGVRFGPTDPEALAVVRRLLEDHPRLEGRGEAPEPAETTTPFPRGPRAAAGQLPGWAAPEGAAPPQGASPRPAPPLEPLGAAAGAAPAVPGGAAPAAGSARFARTLRRLFRR